MNAGPIDLPTPDSNGEPPPVPLPDEPEPTDLFQLVALMRVGSL